MKHKQILVIVLSCIISCLICWPALFQGKAFFYGDNFHLIIPQKIFLVDQIKQGILPFWDPFILSGSPFIADINQAIFYPSTLLFAWLAIDKALLFIILIHLTITGIGQYYLSRSFGVKYVGSIFAMIIWMVTQPLLMTINHVNISLLQSICWLPWILCLFVQIVRDSNRNAAVILPVFLSLAILGGHPQPLIYLVFPGLIYLYLYKRKIRNSLRLLIPSFITAFLMTCFVTLPFIQLMSLSTRSAMDSTESLNDSVAIAHYVDFIIPNFFSDPANGTRWGIYWIQYRKAGVYITWTGLLLYIWFLAKRNKTHDDRWLGIVSLGTLIVALGANLPFATTIVEHVSVLRSVRNFSLLLILWPLICGIICGRAYDQIVLGRKHQKILVYVLALTTLMSFVSLMIVSHSFASLWQALLHILPQISHSSFHNAARDQIIITHSLLSLLISSLCCLIIIICSTMKTLYKHIVFLVVFFIDLFISSQSIFIFGNTHVYDYHNNPIANYINTIPTENYRLVSSAGFVPYTGIPDYWAQAIIRPPFADSGYDAAEQHSNTQLVNRRNVFGSNWNIPYQFSSPFGTSTFILKSTSDYWKNPASKSFNINEVDAVTSGDQRLNDQGVKYFVVDKAVFKDKKIPNELALLPVRYEATDWAVLENINALPIVRFASNQQGVQLQKSSVNEIAFMASAVVEDEILIKTAYYPGWKCVMDNVQPCTILRDDFTMKIPVDAGNHHYRLSFAPTGWPYLLYISVATWIIYIGWLLLTHSGKLEKK